MKNHQAARNVVVIASRCFVVLVCILTISGIGSRYANAQNKDPNDLIAIRDALRRGGVREAAKLKGHYTATFDPHWCFGLFDIEGLTEKSSAIIVGRVTNKLGARIVGDGNLILTDYEVGIEEAIKGAVTQGNAIVVSLPGGRLEFEDGTSAELITPTFEHVKMDGVYTLFLSESDTAPNTYTLVGGPQGLVEIVNSSKVKSHGRPADPVWIETKDRSKEWFLNEVRKDARKWPAPGG